MGGDISGKLLTGNRKILKCGLVEVETYLGWTLMGKTKEENCCATDNVSVTSLDVSLSDLWRLDLIETEDHITVKTREEQAIDAKDYFEETVRIREDGMK